MRALRILAGPRARAHLLERGLSVADVLAVPGAAGGPKGLVLNALDRLLFGHWLREAPQPIHLLGASIGAWRMACACLPDADAALAELAEDYVMQRYEHAPGRAPTAEHVSAVFGAVLERRLAPRAPEILSHPSRRLHVLASRGRHLLAREGKWRTPAGYSLAFLANAAARPALGRLLERVVFSDPRTPLPWPLTDFRTQQAELGPHNLARAVLASCSIPMWLRAVTDVPGAPAGAYWDGGITDYHLHLPYARSMSPGLVLYPHFQARLVPGWLDKAWKWRHRATPALDNVVLLVPRAEWVATLPGAKLPDRNDFRTFGDDVEGRARAWRRAVAEGARLADEFHEAVAHGAPLAAEPLP
ncbi:MAG: patatin-like phospholipase family protein [Rubrivivax sp.]